MPKSYKLTIAPSATKMATFPPNTEASGGPPFVSLTKTGTTVASDSLLPAIAFNHQMFLMKLRGVSTKDRKSLSHAAWHVFKKVPTSNVVTNLRILSILQRRLGARNAIRVLPHLQKLAEILGEVGHRQPAEMAGFLATAAPKAVMAHHLPMTPANFEKEEDRVAKSELSPLGYRFGNVDATYRAIIHGDPEAAYYRDSRAGTTIGTGVGLAMLSTLTPVMTDAGAGLDRGALWVHKHPTATKDIVFWGTGRLALHAARRGVSTLARKAGKLGKAGAAKGAIVPKGFGKAAWFLGELALYFPISRSIADKISGPKNHYPFTLWMNSHSRRASAMDNWVSAHAPKRLGLKDSYAWRAADAKARGEKWRPRPGWDRTSGSDPIEKMPPMIQVHTHLHLDGRRIGEAVTTHQARDAGHPPIGIGHHDGRAALSPVFLPALP